MVNGWASNEKNGIAELLGKDSTLEMILRVNFDLENQVACSSMGL